MKDQVHRGVATIAGRGFRRCGFLMVVAAVWGNVSVANSRIALAAVPVRVALMIVGWLAERRIKDRART